MPKKVVFDFHKAHYFANVFVDMLGALFKEGLHMKIVSDNKAEQKVVFFIDSRSEVKIILTMNLIYAPVDVIIVT